MSATPTGPADCARRERGRQSDVFACVACVSRMRKDRYPRLSLDHLRGFHAAARSLSFTQAATDVFVTQSAISRGVKLLEEQVGQPLFHRVNRRLTLTRAGEELYRCADEIFALLTATVDRLASPRVTLAVTTTVPFASLWLAPRLPDFARLHPEVDLRIVANNERTNMEGEQIDVAIRFIHGKDQLQGQPLADYRLFPICSPALLRDPCRPLRTYDDLSQHVLLDFETTIAGRPWSDWELWFNASRTRAVTPARLLRFSHYDQLIQSVVAQGGIAMGKWPHVAKHLNDGLLSAPFGASSVMTLGTFCLITSPTIARRSDVGSFVQWVKSEMVQDSADLPEHLRLAARPTGARTGPDRHATPSVAENAKRNRR